jgi:D-alanine-D-alanine ligase
MKVGITYDLREEYLREGYGEEDTVEFDSVETVAAIETSLRSLGHSTDRIGHVRSLARRLTQGERWDLVFNIAEGLRGFGREAQVPALLDAFDIPYTFSDPLVLSVALHKGMAKRIVRDLGIRTAEFFVVESLSDIGRVELPFPLFIKPVAEGTSKGVSTASKVCNGTEMRSRCASLLERYQQPVLVEAFLPGREFTVGVIGTGTGARALGILEVLLQEEADPDIYTYANKKLYETRVRYELAEDQVASSAVESALAVWRGLGCRDGGRVDFRCNSGGMPHFIEVNPLAGLDPQHSDLVILARMKGLRYAELIERIVASALQRSAARSAPHGEGRHEAP